MSDEYSPDYPTSKGIYRYNYTLGILERLGNKIKAITINRRTVPIVEAGVTNSIAINPKAFQKCPEYWVELFESVLERQPDQKESRP